MTITKNTTTIHCVEETGADRFMHTILIDENKLAKAFPDYKTYGENEFFEFIIVPTLVNDTVLDPHDIDIISSVPIDKEKFDELKYVKVAQKEV